MIPGLPTDPRAPLEDVLTRIPLFAGIDRVARAQLAAHLDPVAVREGETVCRQGESGDSLDLVAAGRLGVHVHDPTGGASRRIDGLGPGDFFSEMALLAGEPRSATVRAERAKGWGPRGKILGLALTLASLTFGGTLAVAEPFDTLLRNFGAGVLSGEPTPVALPDLAGQTVTLESQRGRVTMLYFWATW